jgi:hypothetical protein
VEQPITINIEKIEEEGIWTRNKDVAIAGHSRDGTSRVLGSRKWGTTVNISPWERPSYRPTRTPDLQQQEDRRRQVVAGREVTYVEEV